MRYRTTWLPFSPHVNPVYDYGMVIYHDRSNGPTPSSCNLMVLRWDGLWNADLD